jgi:hypothetical protein
MYICAFLKVHKTVDLVPRSERAGLTTAVLLNATREVVGHAYVETS